MFNLKFTNLSGALVCLLSGMNSELLEICAFTQDTKSSSVNSTSGQGLVGCAQWMLWYRSHNVDGNTAVGGQSQRPQCCSRVGKCYFRLLARDGLSSHTLVAHFYPLVSLPLNLNLTITPAGELSTLLYAGTLALWLCAERTHKIGHTAKCQERSGENHGSNSAEVKEEAIEFKSLQSKSWIKGIYSLIMSIVNS